MPSASESQLLDLTKQLLSAIADQDWSVYERLCHPSLTCFEPESRGQLVTGMDFHKFYFDLKGSRGPRNTTVVTPQVRLLGSDAAIVSYVRLIQKLDGDGTPSVATNPRRMEARPLPPLGDARPREILIVEGHIADHGCAQSRRAAPPQADELAGASYFLSCKRPATKAMPRQKHHGAHAPRSPGIGCRRTTCSATVIFRRVLRANEPHAAIDDSSRVHLLVGRLGCHWRRLGAASVFSWHCDVAKGHWRAKAPASGTRDRISRNLANDSLTAASLGATGGGSEPPVSSLGIAM